MKKTIKNLLLILAASSLVSCASFFPPPPMNEAAFEFVCKSLKTNCKSIEAPIITYSNRFPQAYGWYTTSTPNVVYLNSLYFEQDVFNEPTSYGVTAAQVVVHETTHYVMVQLNIGGPPFVTCELEEKAFFVEDLWVKEQGLGKHTGDRWRAGYRC